MSESAVRLTKPPSAPPRTSPASYYSGPGALLGGGKVLHPDVALCVQFLELFGASNGHHLLAPTMLSTSIRSGDSALPIPQRLEGDRLVFYGQLLPSFNKSTVAEEGLRPSPLLRP